jgi:hypothetical protein
LNDVWCNSDATNVASWSQLTTAANYQPTAIHRVVVYNSILVAIGNGNTVPVSISTDAITWTILTATIPLNGDPFTMHYTLNLFEQQLVIIGNIINHQYYKSVKQIS